jgi:hypothetical protein
MRRGQRSQVLPQQLGYFMAVVVVVLFPAGILGNLAQEAIMEVEVVA